MVWGSVTFWYVVPMIAVSVVGFLVWALLRFDFRSEPNESSQESGEPILGDYR